MRVCWFITALLAAGCSTAPAPAPVVVPPPSTQATDYLSDLWQVEVSDSLAMLTAVRPTLSGPPGSLSLFDSATQGLASLAGEPTLTAVQGYQTTAVSNDPKALDKIRSDKVALDKKVDDLEKKVDVEKQERIRQQARADAAEQATVAAAIQARKAESVSKLTTVGAVAAGVGVLALLFGSWLNISKLTAGLVIAAGIGITVSAPWLVDLAELKFVIISLMAFLGTDVVVFVAIKTWRYFKPNTDAAA